MSMNTRLIEPREMKPGDKCWIFDDRANNDICEAEILHVLPHPEDPEERLIVYRWFGTNKKWWWYGVTDIDYQELNHELIKRKVEKICKNG